MVLMVNTTMSKSAIKAGAHKEAVAGGGEEVHAGVVDHAKALVGHLNGRVPRPQCQRLVCHAARHRARAICDLEWVRRGLHAAWHHMSISGARAPCLLLFRKLKASSRNLGFLSTLTFTEARQSARNGQVGPRLGKPETTAGNKARLSQLSGRADIEMSSLKACAH